MDTTMTTMGMIIHMSTKSIVNEKYQIPLCGIDPALSELL